MATTLLRTRVDAQRAAAAKKILEGLGLDATTAVNMLFAQVIARRGLPFPSRKTARFTRRVSMA